MTVVLNLDKTVIIWMADVPDDLQGLKWGTRLTDQTYGPRSGAKGGTGDQWNFLSIVVVA